MKKILSIISLIFLSNQLLSQTIATPTPVLPLQSSMWSIEIAISILALIVAFASAIFAYNSVKQAKQANNDAKVIFKLSHTFELHKCWSEAKQINPQNPIDKDVVDANNILSLMADIWLYDIVDKGILMSYWNNYKGLFNQMDRCEVVIESQKTTPQKMLTPEMRKVYKEMEKREEQKVHRQDLK